ncbi:RNA polymerase sigma factor [Neolewinella persica]|uniref:RNA polymerase sigma factor n=1 Tax=Neolewinella persica TaxID=70998 RepID=UPI00036A7EBC|nr:RNA polymerase sigma factor [Neolewinella persica]
MPEPNNRELLQDIANGNALALRTLYGRISGRVYNTALSYVQNEADAEEITQDVFTKIWRSAGSFKAESQVTTWVYRITVNTSLTALKKRERRGLFSALSAQEKEVPDFHHPNAVMEDRETSRALFSAIYRLPDRQKTAFVLSYVEELPRQQVAEVMNLSLKAIESLLMRAKKGLRNGLTTDYPNRGNATAK